MPDGMVSNLRDKTMTLNTLSKALDEIKFTIPIQVLEEAFREKRPYWKTAPIGLDELILTKVIRPRVLVDCNLVGGMMTNVPLEGLTPEFVDNYNLVYRVPKDRTNNRSIVSVASVGYMPYATAFNSAGMGYGAVAPLSMNEVSNTAQRVADSVSGVPPISNHDITLVGENTILIKDQFRVTTAYVLRCILSNEENLNNISPRSYITFAELCIWAVKAYIYNTLYIRVGQAYLEGGQELGEMKSYIDSLQDANENYRTFLAEKWRPTAFMNDQASYKRFLRIQISPAI